MRVRRVAVAVCALMLAGTGLAACGPLRGVVDVAAGNEFACERSTDGTVRCWGANDQGQLNVGGSLATHNPLVVPGVDDAVQLVAGRHHACARFADGTLGCWGQGPVGHGTTIALDLKAKIG